MPVVENHAETPPTVRVHKLAPRARRKLPIIAGGFMLALLFGAVIWVAFFMADRSREHGAVAARFDPNDLDRTATWLNTLEDEYKRSFESGNALQVRDAREKLIAAVKQPEQRIRWLAQFGGMADEKNLRLDQLEYSGVSLSLRTGRRHVGFRVGQDVPERLAKSLNVGDRVEVVGVLEGIELNFIFEPPAIISPESYSSPFFDLWLKDVAVKRVEQSGQR